MMATLNMQVGTKRRRHNNREVGKISHLMRNTATEGDDDRQGWRDQKAAGRGQLIRRPSSIIVPDADQVF